MNPFKLIEEPRGRNIGVNRSLCYESHNSSMHNNGSNIALSNFINQSFEYPNGSTINQNNTINSSLIPAKQIDGKRVP